MNSIFKKSLVAAAVLGTATVNAATITTNGFSSAYITSGGAAVDYPLISSEGFAIAEEISIGTAAGEIDVVWTGGQDYDEETILVFTISGAQVDDSATTPTLGGDFVYLTTENDADANSATITFRLASSGTVDETGVAYNLDGVTLTDLSGALSVSATGKFGAAATPFDAAASNVVGYMMSEFGVAVADTLSGIIDVEEERKQFTTGTADDFALSVTFGADLLGVTSTGASLTLNGEDLSFMRDADLDLDSGTFALTGTGLTEDADETVLSDDNTSLSVTATGGLTSGASNIGLSLAVDGSADADAEVLDEQSFTADVEMEYGYTVGSTTYNDTISSTGLSVGAWTLSGATINIPYMPYGAGISQIIYISNEGDVNGDIEVTAFDDSDATETFGPVTLSVTAEAGKITSLSAAVAAALEAEGYDGSSKKFDLTFVINAPKDDIEVFAAYNVRGDRLSVTVIEE